MKRWAMIAMGLLSLWGCFATLTARDQQPGGVAPTALQGFAAPPLDLPTLAGGTLTLASLRGKPVLLNFWATWCPECRQELPTLQRFQREEGSRLDVVGIDVQEPRGVVRGFVRQRALGWTFLLDEQGVAATAYGVRVLPTSFFLDAKGVVRQTHIGPMTLGEMRGFARSAGVGG